MAVQVKYATHVGEQKLSNGAKRFISFNYDGKDIEDFNLISVTPGDRLQFSAYAPAQDSVSAYFGIDGQQYWGTTLDKRVLNFTLATDGITERELEIFKHHFRVGKIARLILSERPNRYALARVADAPTLSVLPFSKELEFLGDKIKTTEYKGEISISFVLDDPYWYSLTSMIAGDIDKEARRIILEDGVPFIPKTMNISPYTILFANNERFERILEEGIQDFSLDSTKNYYIYNCGSAAAETILSFSLTPGFTPNYRWLNFPRNEFIPSHLNAGTPYNAIWLEKDREVVGEFKFSIPSFLYSYNKMCDIFKYDTIDFDPNQKQDVINLINDKIPNYAFRAKLLEVVNRVWDTMQPTSKDQMWEPEAPESALPVGEGNGLRQVIIKIMQVLVKRMTFNCSFNSRTGEALIEYVFSTETPYDAGADKEKYKLHDGSAAIDYGTFDNFEVQKENCGEMVYSPYLKIDGGDYFSIDEKTDGGLVTYKAKKIKADISAQNGLKNFVIKYNYTYY